MNQNNCYVLMDPNDTTEELVHKFSTTHPWSICKKIVFASENARTFKRSI